MDAKDLPDDLKAAILILHEQGVGDYVYTVRDRELKGWEGPKVLAWSAASATIGRYAKAIGAHLGEEADRG